MIILIYFDFRFKMELEVECLLFNKNTLLPLNIHDIHLNIIKSHSYYNVFLISDLKWNWK
jgi:hypothetical protein